MGKSLTSLEWHSIMHDYERLLESVPEDGKDRIILRDCVLTFKIYDLNKMIDIWSGIALAPVRKKK